MEETKTPTLENWSLCLWTSDPYKPPEQGTPVLRGIVYGHPSIPDGTEVSTSKLKEFDSKELLVKTAHTTYKLGTLSPHFADYMRMHGYTLEKYSNALKDNTAQ